MRTIVVAALCLLAAACNSEPTYSTPGENLTVILDETPCVPRANQPCPPAR